MSATSQYKDFSDLYTGLENAVRVDTGITATENQAKRYINIALQDMHLGFGEKYPWAERSAIISTHPEYKVGTVSVSQGSTAITGVGTLWNTNNSFSEANMRAGGKILFNGSTAPYEISSVTNDTTAVLTTSFTEADVSAGTYVYFEDVYSLASDYLKPIDLQQFSDGVPIDLIGRTEFRRRYVRNHITGTPSVATIVDQAPSGNTTLVRKVRFHKPPDQAMQIPYSYVTSNLVTSAAGTAQIEFSADADEPIVPIQARHAIVLHALYNWFRDKKDDTRSQEAKAEYTDLMLRLVSDTEIGSSRPVFRPRVSHYKRRARSPYSRRGGRYDSGGRFDRFE